MGETAMIHYSCDVCGMTATCVVTPSAELAWLDHMANHAAPDAFRCWTWSALQLPLDPSISPV